MPAGRADVGERLRVFTRNAGLKVTGGCVIEAHGEQLFMGNTFSRTFVVPIGKSVYFYTPHGAPQAYRTGTTRFRDDPDRNYTYTDAVEHIANGAAVAIDIFKAGTRCPNYNLTKIQKSTSGLTGGGWTNYWDERNRVTYDDVVKFLNDHPDAMDIVTIRHRRFKMDMTLADVIGELVARGYDYDRFHCSFCRSAAWYQRNAPEAINP